MHRVPRYCKMCQKSGHQTKPANFGTIWPIFQDPVHIFQNRFLRWNRELKPVVLSTMNPINGTKFFLSYKGGCRFLKSRTPQLKPLKIENFNDFPKTYITYPNNYYQPNWKCDFFNFQPNLINKVWDKFICNFQTKGKLWSLKIIQGKIAVKVR